ncbi:MAG TPA: class I SAM-dependent methyltransferase [Acidimicrobiales bacterium]|nr:class I SAM-dependent methyltransferase [Acidimicrobiales bacterium]
MAEFAPFDRRHYETVPAREGYGAWAPSYDDSVDDVMDLALLERIEAVPWHRLRRVADLGCGSGRTAAWVRAHSTAVVDGVDLTPEMLALARARGVHDLLVEGDARASGLDAAAYDLVVCSLVDEHLPDLGPLYREARRLLTPGGFFVLVGVHPYFLMGVGMPTHFESPRGPVAIETHLHLPGAHVAAGAGEGLVARELHEGLVGDRLIALKPSWERYRHWPFSAAWVWSSG